MSTCFFIPVEIIMKYLRWDLSSRHYSPTLGKLWRRRTLNQKNDMQIISPRSLKDVILKIHVHFHGDEMSMFLQPACLCM